MKDTPVNRRQFLHSLGITAGGITLAGLSTAKPATAMATEEPAHWKSTCSVDVSKPGAPVPDIGRGQQLEEFNHQFQGGLYAQLINNPAFNELDNPIAAWSVVKSGSSDGTLHAQSAYETEMLNPNQQHCARLSVTSVSSGSVALANAGYWGIAFKDNTPYKVSFWARKGSNFSGTLKVRLESNDGAVYAESKEFKPEAKWQHFTCEL